MPRKLRDLVEGELFGKLTVKTRVLGTREKTYLCECLCGTQKPIKATYLLRSIVKTCGSAACRNRATKHGMTDTPLYSVWSGMRHRVKHPTGNNSCYKGLTICTEWDNFTNFHSWAISAGYEEGKTIDRIEGNKGYFPDNCRWVNCLVQSQNRKGHHNAEVPIKGVYRAKPRNGEVKYAATGKAPYYWIVIYKGERHQRWGFTSAEEAYENRCTFIKENYDGLVIP